MRGEDERYAAYIGSVPGGKRGVEGNLTKEGK
jgi:hypothetical protein